MRLQLRHRARAQAPFLTVLAVVTADFCYLVVQPQHWRRGVAVFGSALLLAGLLRLLVPAGRVGLLAVRGLRNDALCYLALGVLILIVDIRLQN